MATVLPGPRENPWGTAFSGMMNMALMQKQWNKFLDSFQAGQPAGALQANPQSGVGMGVGPGMGQNTPATMGNVNQMFGQPQQANPFAQIGQGLGRGLQGIGQGIGGMLGMNRPQNPMAMAAPEMMRGGAMPATASPQMNPMAAMGAGMPAMGPMGAGLSPLMLQMMMMRRGMGGY